MATYDGRVDGVAAAQGKCRLVQSMVQSRLRSLLWREWTRPLESWSPGDMFDADGACWPFSRRDLYVGGLMAKLCVSADFSSIVVGWLKTKRSLLVWPRCYFFRGRHQSTCKSTYRS